MEHLIKFDWNNGFYISYANNYTTRVEDTHLTKFENDELNLLSAKTGLEFHYELHFSPKEKFVRFDCHCIPYFDYANKSKQFYLDNHRDLYNKRTALHKEFKKAFSASDNYYCKANRYNYLGLLYADIPNDFDYNKSIEFVEEFIKNTYETSVNIIRTVLNP